MGLKKADSKEEVQSTSKMSVFAQIYLNMRYCPGCHKELGRGPATPRYCSDECEKKYKKEQLEYWQKIDKNIKAEDIY